MQATPWSEDTSNFRCLDCGLVFSTEEAIQAHIAASHSEQSVPSCDWQEPQSDETWQYGVGPGEVPEDGETQLPLEENDNLVVMDWTEEGTVLSPPTVQYFPPPQTFHPRPAYFSSTKSMSPHDFRPPGISPMVIVEYFCKVCGEIVPRIRFCAHISGHFRDIYLPRTNEPARCITGDFIQQGGQSRKPVRKEDCRTCSQGGAAIAQLRQTLVSLAEVFSGGEVGI